MAVYDPGDRPNFPLAEGVALEGDGYVLTGTGNGNEVDLASGADSIVGVSFRSTLDEQDENLLTGGNYQNGDMQGAAVHFDGIVNVKCEAGTDYTPGMEVELTANGGIAGSGDGTNTAVGTVMRRVDLTDADGPENVPVDITGNTGGA